MAESRRRWKTALVPGFLLILLLIQLVHGFSGFEGAQRGVGGILEAPGTLLGWGGVAILLVLFGWLLYGWAGRDLFGMKGAGGLAVRLVGCVAFGVALAGLLGLAFGRAGGGSAGDALGQMLWQIQPVLAVLVLVLMLVPSALLAAATFFQMPVPQSDEASGYPDKDRLAALRPPPGIFEGSAAQKEGPTRHYPERRFDEDGNEIPMTFDARDVGPVRYSDDPATAEAMKPPEPPPPVPAPDRDELPAGVRFADEEEEADEEEGLEEAGTHDASRSRVPLPPGVRFADEDEPESEEEPEGKDALEDAGDVDDEELVEEEEGVSEDDEEALGEDAEDELTEEERSARYRAKLAGSGFFDESEPAVEVEPAETKKVGPKKKATRKKATRKAAARKKTSPAKAKAKAKPKKKAKATPKKKAGSRKQTTASKKKPASAKKKAAAKGKSKPQTKKKKKGKETSSSKATKPAAKAAKAKAKPRAKRKPVTRKAAAPPPERASEPAAAPPPRKGAARAEDPELFRHAVEAAFERGAASSVLLSRRLGVGYAKARGLMELLVKEGILGEMTPSGARPLLITEEEWEARK